MPLGRNISVVYGRKTEFRKNSFVLFRNSPSEKRILGVCVWGIAQRVDEIRKVAHRGQPPPDIKERGELGGWEIQRA